MQGSKGIEAVASMKAAANASSHPRRGFITRCASLRLIVLLWLTTGAAFAQDANVAIRHAVKAMGDARSIRYSGTGKWGVVGMNWNPTAPWHTSDVSSYIRTIDYPSSSSTE